MAPATVRYVLELRAPDPSASNSAGAVEGGRHDASANNSQLCLTALAIESSGGELESLPVPTNKGVFLRFDGPLPPRPQESPMAHFYASGQS